VTVVLANYYVVPATGSNDHVAINAAITALIAAGGGTVRLTAGDYEIGEDVAVSGATGITIEGEGYDTHLRLTDNTEENVITVTNRGERHHGDELAACGHSQPTL
jgi:hypothetical protein